MVSQIGGYTGYGTYDQSTYATQVQSAIAQGKRDHTYVWWQNITDYATADAVLDHFLPKVQTPKGSIVALDIELGGQNTDVIMHALDRIEKVGYTPKVLERSGNAVKVQIDQEPVWLQASFAE